MREKSILSIAISTICPPSTVDDVSKEHLFATPALPRFAELMHRTTQEEVDLTSPAIDSLGGYAHTPCAVWCRLGDDTICGLLFGMNTNLVTATIRFPESIASMDVLCLLKYAEELGVTVAGWEWPKPEFQHPFAA
ncbi:hypothetical protein [Aeromicrobium yanjiei]|uniref:Uncharacterized protein n=1 Tax=Aeromicrobium yanjiei TaxID=2662028 RepID=A0A5Q2MJ77_9ACTN|nr:hypothetical protein [Aeromicrobium yanjiei]QGG41773.1 hypothetical protein GEV26_10590 [Aeromicrobium yanjiei]